MNKINIFLKYSITIAAIILLASCGRAHIKQGVKASDLKSYSNIIIKNVRVYSNEENAKENQELQNKMKQWEGFARTELEEYINKSKYKLVKSVNKAKGKTLTIDLEMNVEYGNRALRYFVGFGAGSGGIDSKLTVKDAKTGKIKFQSDVASDLSGGGFGGDMNETIKENIKVLVEHYKNSSNS